MFVASRDEEEEANFVWIRPQSPGFVRPSRFFASSSSLSRLANCKRLPERDGPLMRLSIVRVGSARPPISLRRRVRVALFAGRDIHASHTLPSALSRHGSGPVLSFLPRSVTLIQLFELFQLRPAGGLICLTRHARRGHLDVGRLSRLIVGGTLRRLTPRDGSSSDVSLALALSQTSVSKFTFLGSRRRSGGASTIFGHVSSRTRSLAQGLAHIVHHQP
jgi:hypothetical protein